MVTFVTDIFGNYIGYSYDYSAIVEDL